jgi:hypothetical protein
MLDAIGGRQLAVRPGAEHAGRVSDDAAIGPAAGDPADDDVLDIGPRGNGPRWLGGPTRRLQRMPHGARWAFAAVVIAALVGYGASRAVPQHSARPVPTTSTSPLPAAGTESHYPGLLQEYNDQRRANARDSAHRRP